MSPQIEAIIGVCVVSLISFAGVITLAFNANILKKISTILISLAAGTLLGDSLFHIIPELHETNFNFSILGTLIIVGILSFFFLEKLLHWHHCHKYGEEITHTEGHEHTNPTAINNIIADGIHNLVDGLVIGASFMVSTELGIATVIAVILHEIPQEFGDFGILIHSGFSAQKALLFNFFSALTAIVGTVIALLVGEIEGITTLLIAFAAGGFIYIAIGDIFAELKYEKNLKKSLVEFIAVVMGVALMLGLTFFEGEHPEHNDEEHKEEQEDEHNEDEDTEDVTLN